MDPLASALHELTADVAHDWVREARDEGSAAIGYTCSFVPEPLLSVEGLFPQRLRAPSPCGTPMADTYMSSVVCQYPRNLLERALDGGLDHIDGWVFVSSCDHVRRLYDNLTYLAKPPFCAILDLPHKTGEHAVEWYAAELRRLAGELSSHFRVDMGDPRILEAIERCNEVNAVLRAIGALRKRTPTPIRGGDFHRILVAASTAPKRRLRGDLELIRERLEVAEGKPSRARVMVLGSGIDDPAYLDVIESAGAVVVADRYCFGSLPGLEPIPTGQDPFRSMAAHMLRSTQCPRVMGAFDERVEYVLRAVRDFGVDGVLLETMKFCDLWGVEGSLMARRLREASIPVLRLEREYGPGGEGQLRTRVQAFLEAMGR